MGGEIFKNSTKDKDVILVLGAAGQLGQSFRKILNRDALYLDIQDLDLSDERMIRAFFERQNSTIHTVINCSAYTAVDQCEAEEEYQKALTINFKSVQVLGELSNQYQFDLIHFSTDYVFDGMTPVPYTETMPLNPLSCYGKSKAFGEQKLLESCPRAIVIRTSWLYSEFGTNFVKTMKKLMTEKESLGVVYDSVGAPTYAGDLAAAVVQMLGYIDEKSYGVYHFANLGVCSWYDFAMEIKELCQLKCEVRPILTREYPRPAARPQYSVFDTQKIRDQFGLKIPYWKESLKLCLKNLS
jgi:dTDP-4-dehydrorhamnose reductase